MINQSLIAPLRYLPIPSSSRFPSHPCVSFPVSSSLSIVSFLVSYLRLVVFSFLLSNRLVSRLIPSSCYCVSYPYAVVPIRAVIVPVIYHRPAHLFVHHPIVAVSHCPHIAPSPHYVLLPCELIHIALSSLPDEENELRKTVHSFRHRHRPIGFHDGTIGLSTPQRDEKDEPPPPRP